MISPNARGPSGGSNRVADLTALVANIEAMKRAATQQDWEHIEAELLPVIEMLAARQLALAIEQSGSKTK